MATYAYVARRADDGSRVAGTLAAENERQAMEALDRLALLPVELTREESARAAAGFTLGSRRVARGDVTAALRQLADLLRVGVPITRALTTLGGERRTGELPRVLDAVRVDVTTGLPLSEAMARQPRAFDSLAVGIARAGEAGGFLDEALARVAAFRERDEDLRSRIRAALAYPTLLCLLGSGAVIYLMVFFIPRFTEIFKGMGEALPWPTALLIGASNLLSRQGLLLGGAAVVGGFLVHRALQTDAGRARRDAIVLHVPGLGGVLRRAALARFSRVLGTLLKSGVPILEALGVVSGAVGNAVIGDAIRGAQAAVREGRSLAAPMRSSGEFPHTLVDMVEVGEEAGNLDAVLLDAADVYDRDVDRAVKVFVSLLEPLLLVLMGALVGFIVIAMLLPIFTLNSVIR